VVRGVRVLQELEKAKGKGVSQGTEGIKKAARRRMVTTRMMPLSHSASRPEGTTGIRVATIVARKHCSNFGLHQF